jgi:predicted transcriptional regulator
MRPQRDGSLSYASAVPDPVGRRPPGALETRILQVLREAPGPLTPTGVRSALGAALAYTTVQTVLTRLLDKRLVDRRPAGRSHLYWPVQDAASAAADQMRALLGGPPDRGSVLRQFARGLDPADADLLRGLLFRPDRTTADPRPGADRDPCGAS